VEKHTRERLTGAAILVALVVLLVPELLTGPRRAAPQPAAGVDEPPIRSYTLPLSDARPGIDAQPVGTAGPRDESAGQSGGQLGSASGPSEASARRGRLSEEPADEASKPAGMASAQPAPSRPAPAQAAPARSASAQAAPLQSVPARSAPARSAASGARTSAGAAGASSSAPREAAAGEAVAGPQRRRDSRAPALGSPSTREWAVQVGSFGSRDNADRLARQLKLEGYAAFVSQSASGGRKWYRVRVGPERDRTAAAAVAARLRAAGHRSAVVQPR